VCKKTPLRLKHTILGKTVTKKKTRNTQVQTGSYKEAVAGIKMAVIHRRHPDVQLDQTQVDMIQVKLLTAVDARTPRGRHHRSFCIPNLHREYSGSPVQMILTSG
jgi:hypothetical protein